MTISETWHKVGDRKISGKYADEGLEIIARPRSSRGGGVAIVFDSAKVQLKQAFPYSMRYEAVCATGKWIEANEKLVVISAYLPPRMEASALVEFVEETRKKMERIAADLGPHCLVFGGDLNKKDVSRAFEDFPNIKQIIHAPTRGNATLDHCYTNLQQNRVSICAPLFDKEGVESDHAICLINSKVEITHKYEKQVFWSRKYTVEGQEKFGECLINHNWSYIQGLSPEESVKALTEKLAEWQDRFLPRQKHVVRSCDKPWVTKRIKRLIRRKKRAFKRWGKSQSYYNKACVAENETKANKIRFMNKVKQNIAQDNDVRGYYKAIKLLKTEEVQKPWDVCSLFPGISHEQIANKAADFFNAISKEFQPISRPPRADHGLVPPTSNQIRLRIMKMKKPKTEVEGDIDHRLLGRFAAALSVPLKIIFAQVYETLDWPALWKNETVTLLPKNKSPSSLAQLRNISCTPFFSKLLESFVLDGLKEDITLSESQFGGKKAQGVDHLLVETWDEIHRGLEGGAAAVNIMAVDYEKAFNRLDHGKCLAALRDLGAKEGYVALVNAFLHNRTMSVKVRGSFSSPRTINGGSPQGSITGGFLFCATIDKLLAVKPVGSDPGPDVSASSSSLPPSPTPNLETSSEINSSEDDIAGFFRWFQPRRFDDTAESEDLNNTARRNILDIEQPDLPVAPIVKGYIDDFNVIERLDDRLKTTHFTTNRTTSSLYAGDSGKVFEQLGVVSKDLGMKINPDKTQLLCISPANGAATESYIRAEGKKIRSGPELKILGFWFSDKPTVKLHVEKILAKARSRLISLRVLKKSGLGEGDLLKTYTTYIRPLLDYAVPTYHPQLTDEMASELERFQAKAMKIVYGPLVAYHTVIENNLIVTHKQRRERLFDKFTRKAQANPAFREKWFPERPHIDYNLRHRPLLEQPTARTNRYQKSPLLAMRDMLNKNP